MPFMKGRAPIRRTLQYLDAGKIVFKKNVRIFSVNYNTYGDHHSGAKDFVFWYLPQIQYKNPDVQVITFKNMTPSPFIRCYFGRLPSQLGEPESAGRLVVVVADGVIAHSDDGDDLLIDIDSKSKEEVQSHLLRVICKSEEELAAEMKAKEKKDNPANFGYGCDKHCICEIPGQLPCPAVVPLPNHMRGKYKYAKD